MKGRKLWSDGQAALPPGALLAGASPGAGRVHALRVGHVTLITGRWSPESRAKLGQQRPNNTAYGLVFLFYIQKVQCG